MPIYRTKKLFTSSLVVCIVVFSVTAVLYISMALGQEYGQRAAKVDIILKEKSNGAYH